MAEGYKSALIASLRGDAPQGPRMGSGVSPLMLDWMTGSNVPLNFQARRAALLNPERFELPLPLNPPMPSGGGANEPEIPDTTMPPVDVPPSTERGQTVAEKPSGGDAGVVNEPPINEPTVDEFLDNLPPPPAPAPPPEPPGSVTVLPVNAGGDIFADDYEPPVDEPTVDEFLDNLVAGEEPPPEQETETTVTPISYEGESFVVGEPVVNPLQDIEDILATAPPAPDYDVTVDEYQDRPLRDYGGDLGTTVIEGAFDPTLGGIFDPGSEVISPIAGPNDPFANPYMGLSAQELNALLFGGP